MTPFDSSHPTTPVNELDWAIITEIAGDGNPNESLHAASYRVLEPENWVPPAAIDLTQTHCFAPPLSGYDFTQNFLGENSFPASGSSYNHFPALAAPEILSLSPSSSGAKARTITPTQSRRKAVPVKPWRCKCCGEDFQYYKDLDRHFTSKHRHLEQAYSCKTIWITSHSVIINLLSTNPPWPPRDK
ncbi:hypothetical protein F4777DRAFT_582659 [Nemania sp. FL0916]|nr:hypothetical protein F4777DRAFT_582659 [Nemania sp. FL0916]